MDKAREAAVKALFEIETKEGYSNLVLKKTLSNPVFDSRDRAFITELVYGTVTRKLTLDWIISKFSKTKLTKLSRWVLQILRMGIYQIMFLDKVPSSAACNTSVELAKKYAKASSGFVNAILRNFSRQKQNININEIDTGSLPKDLSIKYSMPEFLVKAWLSEFDRDFTEKLLSSLLERPDFYVRVNTLKTGMDDIVEALSGEGISAQPGRILEEALIIKGVTDISKTQAFIDGKITVQDESSMLAARILDPIPGQRVLDVCAAPGGKTTHIAQLMKNSGYILAWDIHRHKTDLIRKNAERLGITIIKTKVKDALLPDEEALGRFDRVLVDVPCTGTGIIRRKPDVKWQRKPHDIGSLVEIQKKILYNSSRYVVPGGILVYSTCSVDARENEQVIHDFLKENSGFELSPPDGVMPALKEMEGPEPGMIRLYPHIHGTDGFFIARLRSKQG